MTKTDLGRPVASVIAALAVALFAGCASPNRAGSTVFTSRDFNSALAAKCGEPPAIPEAVYRDPEFRIATVLLRVKVAPPDRVREVQVARASKWPEIDAAVVRAVLKWQCPVLGTASSGDEWLQLPYTVTQVGYEPAQPVYQRLWAGTYRGAPASPSGDRLIPPDATSDEYRNRIVLESNTVRARLKTRFGLAFSFRTPDLPYQQIPYRYVWTLPGTGVENPRTGKRTMIEEGTSMSETNLSSLLGYSFDEEWELVGGVYTLEIWSNEVRVARENFNVIVDKSP